AHGSLLNVCGIPRGIHLSRVCASRRKKLSQHDVRTPLQLKHRRYGKFLRLPLAYGVVAQHVRIKVVIATVVKNFRDGVPGEEPDTRISKAGLLIDSFQQRGDVITQAKSIAVQEPDRVQHLARGLFVSPSGNVIPKARLDETTIGKEKAPDRLRFLSVGDSL